MFSWMVFGPGSYFWTWKNEWKEGRGGGGGMRRGMRRERARWGYLDSCRGLEPEADPPRSDALLRRRGKTGAGEEGIRRERATDTWYSVGRIDAFCMYHKKNFISSPEVEPHEIQLFTSHPNSVFFPFWFPRILRIFFWPFPIIFLLQSVCSTVLCWFSAGLLTTGGIFFYIPTLFQSTLRW